MLYLQMFEGNGPIDSSDLVLVNTMIERNEQVVLHVMRRNKGPDTKLADITILWHPDSRNGHKLLMEAEIFPGRASRHQPQQSVQASAVLFRHEDFGLSEADICIAFGHCYAVAFGDAGDIERAGGVLPEEPREIEIGDFVLNMNTGRTGLVESVFGSMRGGVFTSLQYNIIGCDGWTGTASVDRVTLLAKGNVQLQQEAGR